MKKTLLALIIAPLALISTNAQAGLINAGFESGDLSGWSTSMSAGTAQIVSSHSTTYLTPATYLPQQGNYFLAITSGEADVWQTVSQTISLAASQTLAGVAAFKWGDYTPFIDGVKVEILNTTGAVVATPFYVDGSLICPSGCPLDHELSGHNGPWTKWSWAAPDAGIYTLVFASRNTIDGGGPEKTYGYFDAHTAPEPGSLALFGLGLAGFGLVHRRKSA